MDVDLIIGSVANYDAIARHLQQLDKSSDTDEVFDLSSGLVQVFGKLSKQKRLAMSGDKKHLKIAQWLNEQLDEFAMIELKKIDNFADVAVPTLLKIILVKGKYAGQPIGGLVHEVVEYAAKSDTVLSMITSEFAKNDDLRFHLIEHLPEVDPLPFLPLLCSIDKTIKTDNDLDEIYASKSGLPFEKKQAALKYRNAWQAAWLHVLQQTLKLEQVKQVLTVMHARIIPNFNKPHLLMDFLVDAYEHGGAVSLLALNALFVLIQYHSLEYPQFFTKLYELLEDGSLLVSAHRARFLRLLDLFLTSTHLPATIPASIIKRLARLALFAPPGAIVAILPFVYNQLKRHPTCMVMIHRPTESTDDEERAQKDPFDNNEPDPILSRAIDSSLWELQSLTTHYHPNVAAIAKIFSQPFQKPNYQLEHFLSHSYETMYNTEYNRKRDREPALEYEQFNVFDEMDWCIT